jgi:hypothetical protein
LINPILMELDKFKGKKVELVLEKGKTMRCIPKHFLEPEEEEFTYLVETFETYEGYPKGLLYELTASQIKEIRPI